jgi:hypothetical protein
VVIVMLAGFVARKLVRSSRVRTRRAAKIVPKAKTPTAIERTTRAVRGWL